MVWFSCQSLSTSERQSQHSYWSSDNRTSWCRPWSRRFTGQSSGHATTHQQDCLNLFLSLETTETVATNSRPWYATATHLCVDHLTHRLLQRGSRWSASDVTCATATSPECCRPVCCWSEAVRPHYVDPTDAPLVANTTADCVQTVHNDAFVRLRCCTTVHSWCADTNVSLITSSRSAFCCPNGVRCAILTNSDGHACVLRGRSICLEQTTGWATTDDCLQ